MSLLSKFIKPKFKPGWLGMYAVDGEVHMAVVERVPGSDKPKVIGCHSYRGSMFDDAALAAEVRAAGFDGYRANVLLAPGEYQMSVLDSPKVPKEEKAAAVRWNIKGSLDYSVDEATIDAVEIPTETYIPSRQASLYAVVAHNDVIRRYAALQEVEGFSLQAIDIPELAQRNVAALAEDSETGLVLLTHDATGCLATFTFKGELYLFRRIEIPFPDPATTDEGRITDIHHRITLDLQRAMDYFDRQMHFIPLQRLLVAPQPGTSSLDRDLADNLRLSILPMSLADLFDISAVPVLGTLSEQAKYLPALGAALRQEESSS